MSKPKKPARRKRPALASLPKLAEQKLVSEPQLQVRNRILNDLHDTIGSCEDLFEQHGEGCPWEVCCLVGNFVGSIRIFEMLLHITETEPTCFAAPALAVPAHQRPSAARAERVSPALRVPDACSYLSAAT